MPSHDPTWQSDADEVSLLVETMTDLMTNHIEGIAIQGNVSFNMPLVTNIKGNLWTGGTPATAHDDRGRSLVLPAYFRYVLNLYPAETYRWHHETTTMRVQMLYDDTAGVPSEVIYELADWVVEKVAMGPTLVHCQAGLNRSALVAGLALKRSGMTADAAIALLRERRSPAVLCNKSFEMWLRAQP